MAILQLPSLPIPSLPIPPMTGGPVLSKPKEKSLLALANDAGFTGDDALVAVAVIMAESKGDPKAVNTKPCGNENGKSIYAVGLMQICEYSSRGTRKQLLDPEFNVAAGKKLKDTGGWGEWATYNNGAYLAYYNKKEFQEKKVRIGLGAPGSAIPGAQAANDAGSAVGGAIHDASAPFLSLLAQLFKADTWFRIAKILFGGIVLIMAVETLLGKTQTGKAALNIAGKI
jgi:hypothetical protein